MDKVRLVLASSSFTLVPLPLSPHTSKRKKTYTQDEQPSQQPKSITRRQIYAIYRVLIVMDNILFHGQNRPSHGSNSRLSISNTDIVEKWLLHQSIEWISRINAQMEWICGSIEEANEYK